jgi:hypothetical protein
VLENDAAEKVFEIEPMVLDSKQFQNQRCLLAAIWKILSQLFLAS